MIGKRVELWAVLCSCKDCGLPLQIGMSGEEVKRGPMAIYNKEETAKEIAEMLGVPYVKCQVTYIDPRDESVCELPDNKESHG